MITEKEFEVLFDQYIFENDLPIKKLIKPNGEVFYSGIRLKTKEELANAKAKLRVIK